jgi:hypothetical protein
VSEKIIWRRSSKKWRQRRFEGHMIGKQRMAAAQC